MQIIREIATYITCDLCGEETKRYVFDEEDGLFICEDCFKLRD